MKKFLLLFMLGVVVISGYQLSEGVTPSATVDNDWPETVEKQV
ncbi:hypothetical protein AB3M96_03580 [Fredinandcohnia sp. 179-A 10B2 NHS]